MPALRRSAVFLTLAASYQNVVAQGGPGSWGPSISFPLVTVSSAIIPDTGNLLVWSSRDRDWSGDGNVGQTFSAEYNWRTGEVSERLVSHTNHDMFCSGVSMGHQGDIHITGGSSATRSSFFDLRESEAWKQGLELNSLRLPDTNDTFRWANVSRWWLLE